MTRNLTQKVPLSDDEMADLLKLSAAMNRQRAPLIRELIRAALQATAPCRPAQVSASRTNREGPRHGHFASHRRRVVLPNAGEVLGAPNFPLRV